MTNLRSFSSIPCWGCVRAFCGRQQAFSISWLSYKSASYLPHGNHRICAGQHRRSKPRCANPAANRAWLWPYLSGEGKRDQNRSPATSRGSSRRFSRGIR